MLEFPDFPREAQATHYCGEHRMHGLLLAVASALVLCSCSPSSESAPSSKDASSQDFVVQDGAKTSKVDRESNPSSSRPVVSLLPDGLIVGGSKKGARTTLARFGDPEARTVSALSSQLGKPKQSENSECEAGAMHFADFGGLKANFREGKFVGWLAEGGKGLQTGEGLSPDWEYSRLERIGATKIPGSTLEGEFALEGTRDSGAIGGFVVKGGKVASLHAGTNCFFR